MRKKALTLLEIIVAAVIFVLIVGGLVNIFISGKRLTLHARWRMTGGELGKFFVDPLHKEVRQAESALGAQDGWDEANNLLRVNTWTGPVQQIYLSAATPEEYTPAYTVSAVEDPAGNDIGIRRLRVDIGWEEITPEP